MYRQCEMRKNARVQTAWIPARHAVVGQYVRLRDDDGWLVVTAGRTEPPAYVLEHKRHRRGDFGSLVAV